jgi:spermidine/putrescine transport system permease protein
MRVTRGLGGLLVAPLTLFLIATVIVPASILFVYSFYDFSLYQVHRAFELQWYRASLSDPLYRKVIRNTLAIALPTTLLSVAGGYCIAYYIVFRARRARTLLFGLVIVSMLASYLARVYAWRILMGENGVINSALQSLGVIDHPLGWLLFSRAAVIIAEVNLYMPITTLIVYASLSSVPGGVREASRDLGAGPVQTFRRVTLPLTGRGVLGAATLAFFLSCGDYITPSFLGGPSTSETFGTTIASAIQTDGNYPLGAALSFVMIAMFLLYTGTLVLAMRRAKILPRLP